MVYRKADTDILLKKSIKDIDFGIVLIGAALFCFVASVFFDGLLPKANFIRCGLIAIVDLVALIRHIRKGIKFRLLIPGIFGICCLFFFVINQGSALLVGIDRVWLLLFSMCLAAAILLRNDSVRWLEFVAKLIAMFALIHAVATVLFFIFPNIYTSWFKLYFYPHTVTANGYKAGLTSHYSTNGMYLAWGLITSFYFGCSIRSRGGRKWQVMVVVILVAILLTTKRAQLVFSICSCFIIYILINSNKGFFETFFKAIFFIVIGFVVFCVVSQFVPEIADVVERLQGAELDKGRLDYYTICLSLFESSPLIGHGWDSFTTTLYQSGISDLSRLNWMGNLNQNAHNVFLQLLAEEGLVGFLLFMGFVVSSFIFSFRAALASARGESGGLYVLSVGVQLFFLLYCITGNPLYDIIEYSVYLLIGVSLSLSQPLKTSAN